MMSFGRFFQNKPKSFKSGASKICHISRIKTNRALIFVANGGYKVALVISLSLKASNTFPDRENLLKNGPNRNFRENCEILQKVSFLNFQCVSNIKMSSKNIYF